MASDFFLKLVQFCASISNVGWAKYSSLYFLENGINVSKLGMITFLSSIAKILSYPTFGILSDLFPKSQRNIFMILILLSYSSTLIFYIEPFHTFLFKSNHFILFVIARVFRSFCNNLWSLTDTITFKLMEDTKNGPAAFGKYRLYNAIGWGLGSIITGYLIDIYTLNVLFIYGAFWSFSKCFIVWWLMPNTINTAMNTANTIDVEQQLISKNQPQHQPQPSFITLIDILWRSFKSNHNFAVSLLIIFVYYSIMRIPETIIFVEMDQEFGANKFKMGVLTSFASTSSMIFFYFATKIIKIFNENYNHLLILGHIALFIRICGYMIVKDMDMIWIFFIVQWLHGLNFALTLTVSRIYLFNMADKYSTINLNIQGSIQSVLGIIMVISNGIGTFIWMTIYDYYNVTNVYFIGSICLIPSIIYLTLNRNPGDRSLFNQH